MLAALQKPDTSEHRPIAVGETLRRLVAKIVMANILTETGRVIGYEVV